MLVGIEDNTVPGDFTLFQNYPNPFNPSTVINYSLNKESHVQLEIFDILGNRIKKLVDEVKPAGNYNVSWYADNEWGTGVSAGVYIYAAYIGKLVRYKKMILLNGAGSYGVSGNAIPSPKKLLKVTNGYKLIIISEDVLTTEIDNLDLSGSAPVELSNSTSPFTAPAKPVASIFLYDLDSKYPEENNFQETTPNGVADLIVFDGNDLENWTTSDANGIAKLKFNEKTFTTLYVAGKNKNDTTYYFFKLEADINEYGEQEVKAFRDPTGIPIIKREVIDGWDVVEWMNWIGEVRLRPETYRGKEIFTTMRISDDKLPEKIYLDRASYMADQAARALDSLSHGRTRYVETLDSNEATGRMEYEATNVLGFTIISVVQNEEEGRAIKGFKIQMNSTNNYVNQEHFGLVIGHEIVAHAEKFNGVGSDPNSLEGYYHSPDMNDISFSPSTNRFNAGIRHFRSEKEKRGE